ncbi:hypothetical protein HDU67_004130 [Dinochytrium kinnereticum]|nr:hypothetical protein HDU67_004130 [Dinochytrium kinnereticum]
MSNQSKGMAGFEPVPTEEPEEDRGTSVDSERVTPYTLKESTINLTVQDAFYRLGRFCAKFPYFTITCALVLIFTTSIGWIWFEVETDPVKLWVGKDSYTSKEKEIFDTNFGPFYRTQQVIIHSTDRRPVIKREIILDVFTMLDEVRKLRSSTDNSTLQDLCTKPIGEDCVVQSVAGYWEDREAFDTDEWKEQFELCVTDPVQCLPAFQQPIKPELVLGGYEGKDFETASAIIVTFVLDNYMNKTLEDRASAWERELLGYFKDLAREIEAKHSSIEMEINKESKANMGTIILSYLLMFFYASLALGKVGIFSFFGVKVTLIIAEVIPFLVLAVGVDNIFILCHTFDFVDPDLPVEDRAALTLAKVGPSILLAAVSETVAFSMGMFVSMRE